MSPHDPLDLLSAYPMFLSPSHVTDYSQHETIQIILEPKPASGCPIMQGKVNVLPEAPGPTAPGSQVLLVPLEFTLLEPHQLLRCSSDLLFYCPSLSACLFLHTCMADCLCSIQTRCIHIFAQNESPGVCAFPPLLFPSWSLLLPSLPVQYKAPPSAKCYFLANSVCWIP